MPYVYILKSTTHNKTYTGSTDDIIKRLNDHNKGYSTWSKRYKPWMLIYKEEYTTVQEARMREKYLKSAAGRCFIKKLGIV